MQHIPQDELPDRAVQYASRRIPGGGSSDLRIAADTSGVTLSVSNLQQQCPVNIVNPNRVLLVRDDFKIQMICGHPDNT